MDKILPVTGWHHHVGVGQPSESTDWAARGLFYLTVRLSGSQKPHAHPLLAWAGPDHGLPTPMIPGPLGWEAKGWCPVSGMRTEEGNS